MIISMDKSSSSKGAASKPTFKERQQAVREQEILDAAERMMSSLGYGGFTLDDVAGAVGVSKPTLYLHFKSKEELIAYVGARTIHRGADYLESLSDSDNPLKKLKLLIEFVLEKRFGPQGLRFGPDMPIQSITAFACIQSAEGRLEKLLLEIIRNLQREGRASSDIPPELLCLTLMSLVRDGRYDIMIAEAKTTTEELAKAWLLLMAPYGKEEWKEVP